jgi:hypothetical protein
MRVKIIKKSGIIPFVLIYISCLLLCNDLFDWFSWTDENNISTFEVTSNSLGYGKYDHGDFPKQITYNYSNNDLIMLDWIFIIRTISIIIAFILLVIYFIKLQMKGKLILGIITANISLCILLPVILGVVEARYIEDIHRTYTYVDLRSVSLRLSGITAIGPTIYVIGIVIMIINFILFPPIRILRK